MLRHNITAQLCLTKKTMMMELNETESAIGFLIRINAVYLKCQERQKNLLSQLKTAKIANHLQENEALHSTTQRLSFFDQELNLKAIKSSRKRLT